MTFDTSVYIGRFEPFHDGHCRLLEQALALAPVCVVVIGSAFQARTPKNPFSWQERAEMIRLAVDEADRERLRFLPLRDYYDETRWAAAVREGVRRLLMPDAAPNVEPRVALIGHFKDATSEYLRGFAGWALESAARASPANATAIRDAYFGSLPGTMDATLAALVDQAPPSTLAFLKAWSALPMFETMAEEWRLLKAYRESWASAPYPPVFVTVDTVVRCADHVLLVRRGQAPGRGLLAVPGGFIEQRETAYQSALRELREETHLNLLGPTMRQALRGVAVFDHPDRSQRGRTITHAHYFDLGDRELPEVRGGDDAASAEWVPIEKLVDMEDRFLDDHFHMLDHFLSLTRGPQLI